MRPALFVIIDDREAPPAELRGLIGYIHFGDLLRRRQRYLDELVAAAASADDVVILRSDEDAERLLRRIESVRGESLWLRLPTITAPMQMSALAPLIRKMRYALDTMVLSPVMEDEAPMVLGPSDAIAILSAAPGRERRAELLRLDAEATTASHELTFLDLRQADALRKFLSGATEPRGFNALEVVDGTFVKSSRDKTKMRAEHGFFALATPAMQRFLLPTFDYVETDEMASYKMEHLRVPDAALQFVLGAMTEAQFAQLLNQFMAFVKTRDTKEIGKDSLIERGNTQIITKMDDRLTTFMQTPQGQKVDAHLQASGLEGGLASLQARAIPLIENAITGFGGTALAFSHGDPCFSNILFDSRIGLIRLIDPRGATTRDDALMHPLYDVAKFSHSVCGGYDFVNNMLCDVEVDAELRLELRLHRGGPPDWAKAAFKDALAASGWDITAVRAVEASLFLSMLPLHIDHPRKLLCFALIAENVIAELEDCK